MSFSCMALQATDALQKLQEADSDQVEEDHSTSAEAGALQKVEPVTNKATQTVHPALVQ